MWNKNNQAELNEIYLNSVKISERRALAEYTKSTFFIFLAMEFNSQHRLKWHLQSEQILTPEQNGFRKYYSMEDHVTYLSQAIEDAFPGEEKNIIFIGRL